MPRMIEKDELRAAFMAGYTKATQRLRGVVGSERECELAFEAWWAEWLSRLPADDPRSPRFERPRVVQGRRGCRTCGGGVCITPMVCGLLNVSEWDDAVLGFLSGVDAPRLLDRADAPAERYAVQFDDIAFTIRFEFGLHRLSSLAIASMPMTFTTELVLVDPALRWATSWRAFGRQLRDIVLHEFWIGAGQPLRSPGWTPAERLA